MTESNISSERIIFRKGQQKKFIETVQEKTNASLDILAHAAMVSARTLRDWKCEKFFASYKSIRALSMYAGVSIPKNTKRQMAFWYTQKAGRAGSKAVIKKYGRVPVDEEYRKKKWRQWWGNGGKVTALRFLNQPLPFRRPRASKDLAEFFGIAIGDGGTTNYQIRISLDRVNDLAYSAFVVRLIQKLFHVEAKVYASSAARVQDITISRSGLITYLKTMGLVVGNKIRQQVDIPSWIQKNDLFLRACIRGLVDTDGCLIQHKYRVNGKEYFYKKLAFTTRSKPLRETVFHALKRWGLHPRVAQNVDVRLDSIRDMKKFFSFIGSHNPKHLKKYYN